MLGAAALHATWNALIKGRSGDALTGMLGLSMVWAVLSWPLVAWVGPLAPAARPALAASVLVHLLYMSLLVGAYRVGDLSRVYPLARGTPPLVVAAVTAWLGEPLSGLGLAGVLALTLGILVLARGTPGGGHASGHGGLTPALWALGCAACTTVYTLLDGYGARDAGNPWAYLLWLTAIQGSLFVIGAVGWGGRPLLHQVAVRWPVALGVGVMSAFGYGIALWAFAQAPIAAVAALRESSVPLAAILGVVWLGERMDARRAVAVACVAVGAVLLRLA